MPYKRLNAGAITDTIEKLHLRINERFPGSSLSKVAEELQSVTRKAADRVNSTKYQLPIRICTALVIILMLGAIVFFLSHLDAHIAGENWTSLLQAMDAAVNQLILTGAAVFFLVTIEQRIKRKSILRGIHELRSLAHVIDMHQLTKDPERISRKEGDTASSPQLKMSAFELGRYLDYCSELLSLTGKTAALYGEKSGDQVVLAAVESVEELTSDLSSKIWQKILVTMELEKKS